MRHAGFAIVAGGLSLALAAPLAAKELKDAPVQIDPGKAYVVVELGALAEGRQPGSLVLTRYDAAASDIAGLGRAAPTGGAPATKPVREFASKGAIKDKVRDTRLHLLEVEPGLYVVEAANGTSFSLGSRSFDARAGTVTDLGVMAIATDYAEGESAPTFGAKDVLKMALFGAFAGKKQDPRPVYVTANPRGPSDIAMPPSLAAAARPVVWERADAVFGNHLGGLVNRFGGRKDRAVRPVAPPAPVPATVLAVSPAG